MLVALNKNGDRIFSQKATKEEKYYCPTDIPEDLVMPVD